MLPAACLGCSQPLDLYDTEHHTHCPRCGHTIPSNKELRHDPTAPV